MEYTKEFFDSGATGYIANPNATFPEQCGYCTYSTGEELYSTMYKWDKNNRNRNLGIMVVFFVFNIMALCVFVYFKRKAKR